MDKSLLDHDLSLGGIYQKIIKMDGAAPRIANKRDTYLIRKVFGRDAIIPHPGRDGFTG
jgi:hypothetical protein